MSQSIRSVVIDPSAPERLAIKLVTLRDPDRNEVVVRVTTISLNRGETRQALQLWEGGVRPGWDFVGIVETEAADGSGPKSGARVVGVLPDGGAWAERLNCPTADLTVLPSSISDAQAATLPVAGLTALHALRKGGLLVGRKVLIDGASGGVGHFACQLAKTAGAQVWAHVRNDSRRAEVERWTGASVVCGPELNVAKAHGPYWLILDSVGSSNLADALTMLAPNGTCVTLGISGGLTSTFDSRAFFMTGGVKLYGLMLFQELLNGERAGPGLALLVDEVVAGRLTPHITVEAGWNEIGVIARRFLDRDFTGKVVLRIS
jgi:NADPH:quinone reductase-like Zn-dependent oxidoreductase